MTELDKYGNHPDIIVPDDMNQTNEENLISHVTGVTLGAVEGRRG